MDRLFKFEFEISTTEFTKTEVIVTNSGFGKHNTNQRGSAECGVKIDCEVVQDILK